MEKLAERIWRGACFSLAVSVILIGSLRYYKNNNWWDIDTSIQTNYYGYNSSNSPLVYYSIQNLDESKHVSSELYVKNIIQQKDSGKYGAFENVLPGQAISLKLNLDNQSIRSPSFILRSKEIRLLTFTVNKEGELVYLGSYTRIKRLPIAKLEIFSQNQNLDLFTLDVIKEIEKYKPLEEAAAKENIPKEEVVNINEKKKEEAQIINLFTKFKANLLPYSQFYLEYRSICE